MVEPVVLVTGSGGFVGSRVVELMAQRGGARVRALDVSETPRLREISLLPGVETHVLDLRDTGALAPLVAGAHAVVHLAAVRTEASSARPKDAHDVNVGTTYDLLSLATEHQVRRFVFGSTNTVYGSYSDPAAAPRREDQPWVVRGINMYAATKLASEAYLEAFAGAGGPDYLSLRIGPIYGPGIARDSKGAMLLSLLEAVDRGEQPSVAWTADSVHSFVYVDDVAEAVIASISAEGTGRALNVVGQPLTAEALCERAMELYGHGREQVEYRGERVRYQYLSQDLMAEVLGFVPGTSLDDGLRALIDWHRSGA